MAIRIQKTSDMDIDSVKCVVYGGAGVGKTRLAATAPNPIIISAEEGLLSLSEVDCDYVEVKTLKEFDEAYKHFRSDNNYDSICLDSLSEICEVLLQELIPDYKDPRQAYNAMAQGAMPLIRKFRRIKGKHTVFTSKLIRIQDEESGDVTEELFIPGRVIPNQIPYMVDELFCMQVDRKGVPFLQTTPDRMRFCKDRSGALAKKEYGIDGEIPNMTDIITKIMLKKGN